MDANNRLAGLYKDPNGTKDKVLGRVWEMPNFSCPVTGKFSLLLEAESRISQ